MTDKMIAYCGLICTDCPAYVATRAGDMEALARVAVQWSQEFNAAITPESILCDGCLSSGPRLCSHCAECNVRACATGKGVLNCAHCDAYGCETISGFFNFAPDAKAVLDGIRQAL